MESPENRHSQEPCRCHSPGLTLRVIVRLRVQTTSRLLASDCLAPTNHTNAPLTEYLNRFRPHSYPFFFVPTRNIDMEPVGPHQEPFSDERSK